MHRTLSILIIFLIASASLLLMFGSNIFSDAMAIEEVDWYGVDRDIKYAMDIANSPYEEDDYDPLLLEREYTNSYEEEKKEQYTDYNIYDNYDNKYSKHSTKDNRFVCKEGQFTGFVTNLKFCDINIVGPQGPQGPQGIQGAPGSVNVTNAYVVWRDNTSGNYDIFFRASQTSDTINLSNNTGTSISPQITSEGNNVYVVWEDSTTTTGNPDIFFSRSNDNGLTFSTPVNLSNNIGTSQEPEISAEGNKVYVVWFDNTPGNYDIFFTQSNDNGLTFSTPVNWSNTVGESSEPQISTEGDNVYVVWQDRTPGNPDIFYITNNLDFGTFGNIINISNNAGESFNPQISSSTP